MGVFRQITNTILQPVEHLLTQRLRKKEEFPPIFIVGSPRSGSTLLSQALVQYYQLGYISNFSRNFYRSLITGSWIQQHLLKPNHDTAKFRSNYGQTDGLLGANEAADFWYQWFPRGLDVYVESGQIPPHKISQMKRVIKTLSQFYGCPVLFKNLYNSMRIHPLLEAFPHAIILVCERDHLDTGQSLFIGRKASGKNMQEWWSVPPRQYSEISDLCPEEQVILQSHYILEQINSDLEQYNSASVYRFKYEEFCKSPIQQLDNFGEWCKNRGLILNRQFSIPASFSTQSGQKVSDESYNKMKSMLKELQG